MEDIKIIFDTATCDGDIEFADGDFTREPGLDTAVFMSLFTDRRARADDPLINEGEKRGWWGDQVANVAGDQIGSRLWLLERAKTTVENLKMAREYINEALQWLIDDGVARKIIVGAERENNYNGDRLYFVVEIYKTDGNVEAFEFDDVWLTYK